MNPRLSDSKQSKAWAVVLLASALTTQAAVVSFTRPNTNAVVGPVTTTLNGTTFVNLGLQGVGRIAASALDAFGDTYGSVSALAISDWAKTPTGYAGTFFTLPDRGYNSGTFFSDYAARLHRLSFTFTPYTSAAPVGGVTVVEKKAAQNQIVATYGGGTQFTLPGGSTTTGLDPAGNTTTLLGKTVPFVPTQNVAAVDYPIETVSFDSEGLVLLPDGSGWLSDEYAATVYYFNANKEIVGIITPPAAIQPHAPVGTLNFDSVNPPLTGRRNNQGMEGVALSPDGTRLFTLLQSATIQDSTGDQQTRLNTRLLVYDVSGTDKTPAAPIAEYVLQLPIFRNTGNGSAPNRTAAQSEMIALGNCQVLVLSRDGNGNGSGSANQAMFKSILLVDLAGATDIAGTAADLQGGQVAPGGVLSAAITPVNWVDALNMLNTAELTKFNFNLNNGAPDELTISEKWEGLALVSVLDPATPNDYFLFVANDNDFITANGTMLQGDGTQHAYDATNSLVAENDTVFLAYRVRIADAAPVISQVTATPNVIQKQDTHPLVPVVVSVQAADNCGVKRSYITGVTSNEPVNGTGDGDYAPDWVITGDLTVNLRAERSGNGTGRIYTITVVSVDDRGNRSLPATVTVTVPKSSKK